MNEDALFALREKLAHSLCLWDVLRAGPEFVKHLKKVESLVTPPCPAVDTAQLKAARTLNPGMCMQPTYQARYVFSPEEIVLTGTDRMNRVWGANEWGGEPFAVVAFLNFTEQGHTHQSLLVEINRGLFRHEGFPKPDLPERIDAFLYDASPETPFRFFGAPG